MSNLKKILCVFIFILIFPLSATDNNPNTILISAFKDSYFTALQDAQSHFSIVKINFNSALRNFENTKNIAVFETEAAPLENAHPGYSFTPHYIETVIIAIDRDQTDEIVLGWNDLLNSTIPINFLFNNEVAKKTWNSPETYNIITSMAHALYGKYDIKAISQDFKKLNNTNRFFTNDNSKPISVMYDSDAVKLIEQGRNIEIIFPQEGTHSFRIGILHNIPLGFNEEALNNALINNGLRLMDGRTNDLYPNNAMYQNIPIVEDFAEFNKATNNLGSTLRRDAFDVKRFGLADNKERSTAYLICIIVVLFYLISISLRLTQKNIRSALIILCILELLLATTQYIKSFVSTNPTLETFLWYAFYFSFVMIPVVFVYVAVVTGKQNKNNVPLLYKIYFYLSFLPIIFVATNNIHQQVFIVYNYYHTYYDYNWGYYFVMIWIYASIAFALALLIIKSFQSPRKWAFILPITASIFALSYTIGIILRIPIARDFEVGYGTGIVLFLCIEACIQSRLFPINRGHKRLFSKSSLKMEVHDNNQNLVLMSDNHDTLDKNFLLRKNSVVGGTFWHYEDYTELNKTREKLSLTNKKLKKSNALLKKKNTIEAELVALSTQKEVYKKIDVILNRDTKKIFELLDAIPGSNNIQLYIAKINIIACGIKRESLLGIRSLYKKTQKVYDFFNYIHEMVEFVAPISLKITIGADMEGEIDIRHISLMYEFFRETLEKSVDIGCKDLLVQVFDNNSNIVFSVIANKDILPHVKLSTLKKKATQLGAKIIAKPWDETTAFHLTFGKGGLVI